MNTSTFSSYSTNSSSKEAMSRGTLRSILNTADWSSTCHSRSSITQGKILVGFSQVRPYYRPQLQSHVVIWSLNPLICNFRMAKDTKCQQAILDCMRGLKVKYHNIPSQFCVHPVRCCFFAFTNNTCINLTFLLTWLKVLKSRRMHSEFY